MKTPELLYAKVLLIKRFKNIEKDGGIDMDRDGKIQDNERIIDANGNGVFDKEEYLAFVKANEQYFRKEIPVINDIYSCRNITPDNIINDCFAIESDLFTPEQTAQAYKMLDEMIGRIKGRAQQRRK